MRSFLYVYSHFIGRLAILVLRLFYLVIVNGYFENNTGNFNNDPKSCSKVGSRRLKSGGRGTKPGLIVLLDRLFCKSSRK